MKNKILVIGSINIDLVVYAQRHPIPGETILGDRFNTFPGGKGANQAIAAARLGGNVQMVGRLGKDTFGQALLDNLRKNQVDSQSVFQVDEPTGTALITVDAKGQNTIIVVPGANATLTKADIDQLKETIRDTKVLVLQLEIPLDVVIHAINIAYEFSTTILLNPAPAAHIPIETLRKVTYIIPNESELALLSGKETNSFVDCRQAANQLFALGCKQIILTRGEHGAYYLSPDHQIFAPPFKVAVVDTTAAGDAFIGEFAVALAEDMDLHTALLRASAAGALAVTKAGAQTSLPLKSEVEAFLKKHKQEVKSF
ncbi:MAG: ribokinase [Anaerolineaceae bacterium]|nr:ribokinase [Anaerolineaceae bacterium]